MTILSTHVVLIILTLMIIEVYSVSDIPSCFGVNYLDDKAIFDKFGYHTASMRQKLPTGTEIKIRLSLNTGISLYNQDDDLRALEDYEYKITLKKPTDEFRIKIYKLPRDSSLPFLTSIKINGTEQCDLIVSNIPSCLGLNYIEADNDSFVKYGYHTASIRQKLPNGTEIKIHLSLNAGISLNNPDDDLRALEDYEYKIILREPTDDFRIKIYKLPRDSSLPFLTSIKINGTEQCDLFTPSKLESVIIKQKQRRDESLCGKRKVNLNQLIVYGRLSKPGDWPWHVALNRIYKSTFKYICGGTLISENYVLTAAHCITINGIAILPESVGVSLGKHSLIGGDKDPQEREVFKIIVHEDFAHKTLDNDIALLKLSTKAIYNDYIQPACMWFDITEENLPAGEIIGAVAGWGFDQSDSLSSDLRFAKIPMVPDITCIRRKPIFYAPFLNGKRFCAGVLNGTSACNGDSGGGFVVFIPDTAESETDSAPEGVWYIRGIVSIAFRREDSSQTICDPNEYVLFTDINEYKDWIQNNIK